MPQQKQDNLWPGWETVRLIGRGSYGAVYEIRREIFGETESAALKLISIPKNENEVQELLDEGLSREEISRSYTELAHDLSEEYRLLQRLSDCPNVVNCQDIACDPKENGLGWDLRIRMELLTPLTDWLNRERPGLEETAIALGADLCRAVTACRTERILHRDIKPQNIFVSKSGRFKLGDFGVARFFSAEESSTATARIGTYNYMAPEVYNKQRYGHTADICSIGLVLYWLINERRLPFLPLSPQTSTLRQRESALLRRFAGEPIPAPAHGSEALQRIVLKACAFDPAERYPEAETMLRDLEALRPAIPPNDDSTTRQLSHGGDAARKNDRGPVRNPKTTTGSEKGGASSTLAGDTETAQAVSTFVRPAPEEKTLALEEKTFGPGEKTLNLEEQTPGPAKARKRRGLLFLLTAAALVFVLAAVLLLSKGTANPTRHTSTPAPATEAAPTATSSPTTEASPTATPAPNPTAEELLAQGYAQSEDGLFWKVEDGMLTICGEGSMGDYPYKTWLAPGEAITRVTIAEGVTSIGNYAFYNCSKIQSIDLPASITDIGASAFSGCSSLGEITIPKGVADIGEYAFYNCCSLKEITIPEGVITIGNYAFYNCSSLGEITIPASVTGIGDGAFNDCSSLKGITIPKGVTNIRKNTFSGCSSLKEITIPKGVTSIGVRAFSSCWSLSEITLPESVTSIGGYAFSFCWSLSEITLPESVTSIGEFAFASCWELRAISIPASVTNIGGWAFSECNSLKEITIPASVTSIGSEAFYGCSGLTDVNFAGTRAQWENIKIGDGNEPLLKAAIHYDA